MTALDTGGAVAEYLDVVSIGGGARPYTIRQRHTDILQLFQASYERYQCSDKQEWDQGTSLVDPHFLPHWVSRTVLCIHYHKGGPIVNVLASADKPGLDAKTAEHLPHECLW